MNYKFISPSFLQSAATTRHNLIISASFILVAVLVISRFLPVGIDWHGCFRPATLALLSGASPYHEFGFYNPPWALIPLIPLAILPEKVGSTLFFFAGLIGYLVILRHQKINLLTTIVFLASPPVLLDLKANNISWLVMLGYIMPPRVGLFFVLIKPQMGIFVALYWLIDEWRRGGIKQVFRTFLPVSIAYLLSFAIFGFWIFESGNLVDEVWNASLFPLSVPMGLVLVSMAFRKRAMNFAYMASPFFSPYVSITSYSTVLLGLITSLWELLVAVLGLWAVFILAYLFGNR